MSPEPGNPQRSSPAVPRSARERLLGAAVEVASEQASDCCTVDRICECAGVARATFYQYFTSAEDCLCCAYRDHADALQARVTAGLSRARIPELGAVLALAEFAARQPGPTRFLAIDGLAGAQALAERDRLLAAIAQAVRARGPAPSYLDLPLLTLLGGALRFVALRSGAGDRDSEAGEALGEWALSFERRASQPSWSSALTASLPAAVWPPRRAVRPRGSVRERILRATAAVICSQGYRDTTVSDIVRHARVSRRTFYNAFPDKAACYAAVFESGFEQTLAACTPAFLSGDRWPERVWQSAGAAAGFFAREPLIAHLCFVDCYAAEPTMRARVHEAQLAFTIFLEEGYRLERRAAPSRACSAVTAQMIAELSFATIRRGALPGISRGRPLAAYLTLAPFMGCEPASEFLAAKLATSNTQSDQLDAAS